MKESRRKGKRGRERDIFERDEKQKRSRENKWSGDKER